MHCVKHVSNCSREHDCHQVVDDISHVIFLFLQGYLVNWDVQRQVWDHTFGKDVMNLDYEDTNVILAEPYFDFSSIQEAMNEIFFEEYNFKAILRTNGW